MVGRRLVCSRVTVQLEKRNKRVGFSVEVMSKHRGSSSLMQTFIRDILRPKLGVNEVYSERLLEVYFLTLMHDILETLQIIYYGT